MSNHDREGSRPSNRDAALERAWREASDEQPPSDVDAAIIAAARRSVPDHDEQQNRAPARVQSQNWFMRWQPLAAAAAVAGLAFVLVQMLPREATDNRSLPSADKAVAKPERAIIPDRAPAQSAVPAPPAEPASPTTTAEATDSQNAMSADTAAVGEAGADRREAIAPEMAGRTATASAAAPSSAARAKNLGSAAALDAAAWTEKIVALQASGDVAAAADALRAFRAADPAADTYLPESLRDWARTVD
jgi:hypothetical protein